MNWKENILLTIKSIWNYLVYLIFIGLLIFTALIVSGKISFSKQLGNNNISINQHVLSGINLWNFEATSWSNYQFTIIEESENVVWDWITFLSILSTLLAAFFIYSSWKIDNDLKKIEEKYQSVNKNLKEKMYKIEDDIRMNTIIGKANMYLSTKRFEEAKSLLKDEIENQEIQKSWNGYLYSLYKTLADIYRIQWEYEMEKDQSNDHQEYYFNAVENLKSAMNICKWKEDDELLASYNDRYEIVKKLKSE